MVAAAFSVLLILAVGSYIVNLRAAQLLRNSGERLRAVAHYHGLYGFLIVGLPILTGLLIWLLIKGEMIQWLVVRAIDPIHLTDLTTGERQLTLAEIRSIAGGRIFGEPAPWILEAASHLNRLNNSVANALVPVTAGIALILAFVARRRVGAEFHSREKSERIVMLLMILCATVAVMATAGIIASLLFESIRFFTQVPLTEFLFGLRWEPQIPLREDQIAAEGAFGWIPVIVGTLLVMTVAILFAVPVGLLSAIYLNEFASRQTRAVAKPVLEILAGVPTVVYGFFAVLVIAPAFRSTGSTLGIDIAPNTALAAGGVMGIMLIPFISSFADDALNAVPADLRNGALALGATRAEAMLQVLFPAALPGIAGGILLAVSRAIGETMIVVMAAGLIARLTFNPLDSVTTVTVQIVTLLIGDTSFDNPKTLAAFALGLMLFIVTLAINVYALRIVRKYREVYE